MLSNQQTPHKTKETDTQKEMKTLQNLWGVEIPKGSSCLFTKYISCVQTCLLLDSHSQLRAASVSSCLDSLSVCLDFPPFAPCLHERCTAPHGTWEAGVCVCVILLLHCQRLSVSDTGSTGPMLPSSCLLLTFRSRLADINTRDGRIDLNTDSVDTEVICIGSILAWWCR